MTYKLKCKNNDIFTMIAGTLKVLFEKYLIQIINNRMNISK